MELWEKIGRQRVQYIVDSYQLYGDEIADFNDYLTDLLQAYMSPQIELALVETIAATWSEIPSIRGLPFIKKVHQLLKHWEDPSNFKPLISPDQFFQIANLDPAPVFGNNYNSLPTPESKS
ncbi:hypothetical protein Pse7367_1924 [Thalassoporum mexicanum PCC 7367]|uniref:hypothetical protein n=1 Tax=Thalassoporum mexicanum TaxID=3457544 RepID=UPI00029FA2B3|nr:hypothetical protein [Pseudanabaena sp. PCC 7367]AFY70199.1 hypothetical protein Pse7367_1924 [Pseudanabaena sp. PCC 7367]